jgi:hypothetical protein
MTPERVLMYLHGDSDPAETENRTPMSVTTTTV